MKDSTIGHGSEKTVRTAVFSGSFNPFTAGHADIVERGLKLFDRIIIAIGINSAKPGAEADAVDRADTIRALYPTEPRIEVAVYDTLTVDFARKCGAGFILRGIRSMKDFEYERDLATVNTQLSDIETVVLFSRPELSALSSSVVRELASYGVDITPFLPHPAKQ
ncbi:MAG: pantetheine-phosphate adenylyltransferase [Muribaculaceae bacterium]|nr:pantetheine-phosphate adenylyltransferase [Muribaculaceae bacterium]